MGFMRGVDSSKVRHPTQQAVEDQARIVQDHAIGVEVCSRKL